MEFYSPTLGPTSICENKLFLNLIQTHDIIHELYMAVMSASHDIFFVKNQRPNTSHIPNIAMNLCVAVCSDVLDNHMSLKALQIAQ